MAFFNLFATFETVFVSNRQRTTKCRCDGENRNDIEECGVGIGLLPGDALPDSAFVAGTVSDELGSFRLINPGSGKMLRISCIGYGEIYF